MMNKKAEIEYWKSISIIIIIILVFLAVYIVWFVVKSSVEPQFTIYKEECFMKVNQTIYDNCVSKYDGKWDIEGTSYTTKITPNLKDGLILFEFSENTSMSSLNIGGKIIESKNCIDVTLLYESCEQVEVDEIEIKKEVNNTRFCDENDDMIMGREENYGLWCVKNISKQDLSLNWLEENCEWTHSRDYYKNKKTSYTTKIYKCGEIYTVEVK